MPLRVMIVDDALFMRNMLREIFTRAGYEVVAEAENGEEALAQYQEFRPGLVTMDIVMPKMDGVAALKRIVAVDPSARIVMISAVDQRDKLTECIQAGRKR